MNADHTSRRAGVLCPVFALRHKHDLGIGDAAAVRQLIHWAAEVGLRFLQFLPINATGLDNSPYNAISSVALEPLTLELTPEAVPELDPPRYEEILATHPAGHLRTTQVNYGGVRALKQDLLKAAWQQLQEDRHHRASAAARWEALQAFRAAEAAWLEDYCLFCVLMERAGTEDWTAWPAEYGTPAAARRWLEEARATDAVVIEAELGFHAYGQWLCAQQWQALRAEARSHGVALMGDVPFGVSWCSADVFFHPEQFDLAWCGGAPPEHYFKDDLFVQKWGQNWGIPLYNWNAMQADGYSWWRRRVRKVCEVFDIFRIDHVLGFYRIYAFPWRPQQNHEFLPLTEEEAAARTGGRLPQFKEHDDATHENRQANLAAGDRYLRMILEAAGKAEVVAEDLGTVPPYVRPHLLSLGIPGFRIPHWEDDGHGHAVQGAVYDPCSFATYATHDHEPMKTFWETRRLRMETGAEEERWSAACELRKLCQFAWLHPENGPYPPYDDRIRRALLMGLLRCQSRFVAFMLTDLLGLEERFNVPGVSGTQNWSARLPMTVADLARVKHWAVESEWLRGALRESGRA